METVQPDGPRREVTGSRAAQPTDEDLMESDSEQAQVALMAPGQRHEDDISTDSLRDD